jgi:hypothetical protein
MADTYITTQSTLNRILEDLAAKFLHCPADNSTMLNMDDAFQNLIHTYKTTGEIAPQFNAKLTFNQNSRAVDIVPTVGRLVVDECGKVYCRVGCDP